MNLIEALETVNRPYPEDLAPLRVFLACGFTPLHLETFLRANLRTLVPDRKADITTGLFGDLAGNLRRVRSAEQDAVVVVIEWADLDQRLGLRALGGWEVQKLPDILTSAKRSLAQLAVLLQEVASGVPTAVCLPTLPLPPISYSSPNRSSSFESHLRRELAEFADDIAGNSRIAVLSEDYLHLRIPLADRFDLRAETAQGFPYTKRNASAVGQALAELICPCEPKKGLITDLDDVLWAGLLGEVGVDGVHWSLEEDAQLHGIYQQFLASLASAGVLIGGASKNDAALVEQAFAREDLLLPRTSIFPIEAHWAQKSDSVRRILAKWNVLPSAVVFVDDSRMEVAEVQAAFPEMDCLVFPKDDHVAFWQFLYDLRRRFAKTTISEEDQFRLESLRDSAVMQDSASSNHHSLDEFLSDAEGEITFDLTKPTTDLRALELLNKTNQFNLNGRRLDHAEWSRLLGDPERFVLTVSYQDKFGRLGRIAVMIGSCAEKRLVLTHWVMSCRAFSRQIEFHCLDYLFTRFGAAEAVFAVQSTGRNGPLLEFLQRLFDAAAKPNSVLSRAEFTKRAPKLPHKIQEVCALV